MKKLACLLLLGFTISNTKINAQTTSPGIFLAAEDFKNNHLSYTPQQGKKYQLHLNEWFNNKTVNIIIGDSSYQFSKEKLYGYCNRDKQIYRYYNNSVYQIINPKETILLYSKASMGGYKNAQTILHYYFSKDESAEIMPLTKWNLKNAFPNDTVFHAFLDMQFSNDQDLIGYDNFAKQTKLNHLFRIAQQVTSKK